jgi:hypothetical protein
MLKKLLIGLMCVGFLTILSTESNAGWPTYAGGFVGWGSVDCYALWKGFGNTDNNPVLIDCTIFPVSVEAQCMNPAGNIGGGIVFDLTDQSISGDVIVHPEDLNAKGKVETEITIDDKEVFSGLDLAQYDYLCDDFNNGTSEWKIATPDAGGTVNIIQMFVAFRAWVDEDADPSTFETLAEDVHLACKVDDPSVFDTYETGVYDCTELCDKTKRTDCTDNPYTYLDDPEFTFFD